MKVVIYVGCSLTHATEEFRERIQDFKNRLKMLPNVEVLEFLGLVNGTAQDVYEHDIHHCVKKAHFIIGECSYPSTGLGWELGTAVEKHRKVVLAVAHRDVTVTRLVVGAECERNSNYSYALYDTVDELLDLALPHIKKFWRMNVRKKKIWFTYIKVKSWQ